MSIIKLLEPLKPLALAAWMVAVPGACLAAAQPPSITWREFDTKAFKEAKDQDKLVLVSIQAPWGHWDRLMSEITFSDPGVVATIDEKFIPVKVDALLRPDIWARYGMGGWPTTTILLSSGQPMYFVDASRRVIRAGGTYYAAEPLRAFLDDLVKYRAENKDNVEKAADEIAKGVLAHKEVSRAPLTADILEVTITKMLEAQGAWNPDPNVKVYRAPDLDTAELAFAYWIKKNDRNVLDTALHRLADMARGGIHDQLGGGFHRLAADSAWRVPAFEKLLAVNAEMLQAYTDAYMVTGGSRYKEIAADTAGYVLGTLRDPAGWFYAYQAADARVGEDGDYYTWTLEEVKAALTEEEQSILLPAFDVGEWGEMVNTAPRRNVLYLSEGPQLLTDRLKMDRAKVTALFESGRRKLLEARSKRPAPAVGRILISDANAQMDASLIMAGDLMRQPDLTAAGLKGLDFLWEKAVDPNSGLVDHVWSDTGRSGHADYFSDQVFTARALVAAFESTGRPEYLDRAIKLTETAGKAFDDALNGGWMDRIFDADAPGFLSWPTRSLRDNALFAETLVRIGHLSNHATESDLKPVRKALESWADEYAKYNELSAPFGLAVEHLRTPPVEVIVLGEDASLDTLARSLYHPWRIVRHLTAQTSDKELKARQITPPPGASCFFCLGSRCAGPYTKDDKPRAKLDKFLGIEHPAAAPAAGDAKKEGR